MNKAKDIAIVIFASIIVLVGFWGLWRMGIFNKLLVLPEPPIKTTNIVFDIGQPFKLKQNQTAIIRGGTSTIRISDFINSPCSSGLQCF